MYRTTLNQSVPLSTGFHASANRSPNKTALICEGRKLTYGQLAERVHQVCGGAQELGLVKGDRVAVFAPNCLEYPELLIGLSDAGCIITTINPRSTSHELTAACDDCSARVIFVHPAMDSVAQGATTRTVERVIVLGDDYDLWRSSSVQSGPLDELGEEDPFSLVYSSGTTGAPKGIVLSHRSRTLTFHAMAMEYGCYGPDDIQLGIAPMAHGAGFAFIMATLFFGGTVEVMTKFDPKLTVEKLATEPFTGIFMVPTHFHAIFALEAAFLERHRRRSKTLRTIISNASALPHATKQSIVDYWGPGLLHETYGSTEGGIVTNLRPQYQLTHPGSVGPAFALNTIKLLDEDRMQVPQGEVGELFSRSPYLFSGYWGRPEEEAQAINDGWVSAGDLARQDEDGFFYIVDRKKDMVVSGGINIFPREVEEVLHQHPAMLEAAVVGVPDDHFGETLRAFVVLRDGQTATPAELDAHCRQVLAGFKVPKEFYFIDALPRNVGGKILKKELRK